MYGVRGRDGGMGVVGVPVQEEHSHIDLPQHVDTARGSRSKLRRMAATVCERLLAEKTICCQADIQRMYSMKKGGKKCGCVGGGG